MQCEVLSYYCGNWTRELQAKTQVDKERTTEGEGGKHKKMKDSK